MGVSAWWSGVVIGAASAIIFVTVICFIQISQVEALREEVGALREEVGALREEVEEDRQIMKTYKFFNETWRAIIELEDKEK